MRGRPLIAHVVYRLDTGGMERVLVTVMNQTRSKYRHAVICLDGFGSLRDEIEDADVTCLALHKRPGKDWRCYFRLWKALRKLKPDLVQSYNFGALDTAPLAKIAGVRRVVHAERGRDASDPNGDNRKYRYLRRIFSPFIDRYLAVSRDLQEWLIEKVGIDASRVVNIANGIDPDRYVVRQGDDNSRPFLGEFAPSGCVVIGTVGRLDPVKDQVGLITAFNALLESMPETRNRLRLVVVGEGSQRYQLEALIEKLGLTGQVRLLGNRNDVPSILPEFDIFVLSSIAEGMPGVLLEAMAAGLPVVATDVGGVSEVVLPANTGLLVTAGNPRELATALAKYVSDEELRKCHGQAGRERVTSKFSLDNMVSAYIGLYDELLKARNGRKSHADPAHSLTERKEG